MTLNVYEHWSAISPKCEPFRILTGHCLTVYWWIHNDLRYDAIRRPALLACKHTQRQRNTVKTSQKHNDQVGSCHYRYINWLSLIALYLCSHYEDNMAKLDETIKKNWTTFCWVWKHWHVTLCYKSDVSRLKLVSSNWHSVFCFTCSLFYVKTHIFKPY